ncbi:MAG: SemiSWEET family sugar transporter [Nitrospirota bacterium]
MDNDYITLIGLLAATLTTASFIPQVVKTWKLKETKDLSLWMLLLFSVGIFLWLLYGVFIKDLPVILANLVTFVLVMIILFFKLKYR